jgi:hypothetical protein
MGTITKINNNKSITISTPRLKLGKKCKIKREIKPDITIKMIVIKMNNFRD